ncbi:hypothetical protein C8R43DRAFT_102973 [Mycena crocata]|nr:hypothetical protein C8R43DRAFT_102973 [Mycena crocata]
MDTDLKCNRLTCRRPLTDKAVVSTAQMNCLMLLGFAQRVKLFLLNRMTLCAMSFWQYQSHQENSFQQAVVRNVNDKNAQLQKQIENVVREANGEINLLSNKNAELERDLELERRKVRDLQDATRERDKEYQKLKAQLDKIKRKALLAPNGPVMSAGEDQHNHNKLRAFASNSVDLGAVVGGMEASGIHRTPLVNRTAGGSFGPSSHSNNQWGQQQQQQHQQQHQQHQQPNSGRRTQSHRQPFATAQDRAYQSGNTSDRSASAHEVENMLLGGQNTRQIPNQGWSTAPTPRTRPIPRVFAPPTNQQQRMPGSFRPAGVPRS